jgi:hypothetical protein
MSVFFSHFRSGGGGFGSFKKKGTFGRGNVRKRVAKDEDDDDEQPASATVAPAEKKKKANALGGSTARDDKVTFNLFPFTTTQLKGSLSLSCAGENPSVQL